MSKIETNRSPYLLYTSKLSGINNVKNQNIKATVPGQIANDEFTSNNKSDLRKEFEETKKQQGIIGKAWDGIKNLFGAKSGSKHIEKVIKQAERGEISTEEAQEALNKYKEGQKTCVDVVADLASGILAVGAFALAVPTGGASLAVGLGLATAVGAGVKVGIKAGDAIATGKEYAGKDLLYDTLTGGINGVLAPITNGLGNTVTKTIGKKLGLKIIQEGAEEVAEQGIKLGIKQTAKNIVLNQTIDVAEGTIGKRALAIGAGMAIDGALGGASDNMLRAGLNGENVIEAGIQGAIGGAIMSPVIGGGFRIAGKAGKALNNKITTKFVLPDGVNTKFKQGEVGDCALLSTIDGMMNNPNTAKTFKKSITKTISGDYNVRIGDNIVKVAKSSLSDEMLSDTTGIRIFEQAYKQLTGDIDGGFAEVVAKQFGLNPVHIANESITDELLDTLATNRSNTVLSLGTLVDTDGAISPIGTQRHYFTIKDIDSAKKTVKLTSPIDTSKTIELSYDDVKALGISIDGGSIKELEIPNKIRNSNDIKFKGKEILSADEIKEKSQKRIQAKIENGEINSVSSNVTSDPYEQELINNMIAKEAVYVDEVIEKDIMNAQFHNFMRQHPEINPQDIYIYSPMPKQQIKSYTRSGNIFAEVNGIDKSKIITNMAECPKGSVVFIPDDCSITGASMVFDLFETLPKDFDGHIVFAPTVMGAGNDLNDFEMADYVLGLICKMNKEGISREAIVNDSIVNGQLGLNSLISDGKPQNISMLNEILLPENYSRTTFSIAEGGLNAKNFRNNPTFESLSLEDKRLLDAIFTASSINKGYHSSGTMVLLTAKTPNNNVGIMELYGNALGLQTKPNGALRYIDSIKLAKENKKNIICIIPQSNNHGNFKDIIVESTLGNDKQITTIPYNNKNQSSINVVFKLPTGEEVTLPYTPKAELKSNVENGLERDFGIEIPPELLKYISILKGEYKPKSIKPNKGYWVDVVALAEGARIKRIGDISF